MMTVSQFFASLPQKCCSVCGHALEEQAESYVTECFQCAEQLQLGKQSRSR